MIKQFIEKNYNYLVLREYYVDLKDTNYDMNFMRFDLFLPELSLAIEYDSEQHYRPVNYGGGVEESERQFEYVKKMTV